VKRARYVAMILAILMAPAVVMADDLTGSNTFLCSLVYASKCMPDGECAGGPAWNLDIPQFIEVNLKAKTLNTTKASGEDRSSAFKNLERGDDLLIIQGVENGRAISLVITESTGGASLAVALADKGVVAFGACTPN
jgi:hypothetical protein